MRRCDRQGSGRGHGFALLLWCTTALTAAMSNASLAQNTLRFTIDCDPVLAKTTPEGTVSKEEKERLKIDLDKTTEGCLLPALPNYFDTVVQLGITRKKLADEKYIIGSVEEAKRWYELARSALAGSGSPPQSDRSGVNTQFDLLRRDIDYRLKLISVGADFWGSGYFNHPANPVKLLEELRATYADFNRIVREIEEYQTSAKNDAIAQATLRAVYNEASAGSQAERWRADQQSEVMTRNDQSRRFLFQRMRDNKVRQQEIAEELRSVRATIDSLNSQLTKTAISALGSAVGVNPGVVAALTSEGDVATMISAVGAAALADPGIVSAVQKLSPDAPQLFEAARLLQRGVADAKDVERIFRSAKSAIQSRDLRSLMDVGTQLFEKLPASQKAAITKTVREKFSSIQLIRIAAEDEKQVRSLWKTVSSVIIDKKPWPDAVKDVLASAPVTPASRIVSYVVANSPDLLRSRSSVVALTEALINEAISSTGAKQLDPDTKLSELRAVVVDLLPGVSSNVLLPEDILKRLAIAFDAQHLGLEVDGGSLRLKIGSRLLSFAPGEIESILDKQFNLAAARATSVEVSEFLGAESREKWLIDQLVKTASSRPGITPAQILDNVLASRAVSAADLLQSVETSEPELLKILTSKDAGLPALLHRSGASFLLAQGSSAEISAKSPRVDLDDLPLSPRRADAEPAKMEEQVASLLIGSAVPGGSVAVAVLSTAKMMGQLSLAIEKGRELYDEDRTLIREQIHLADMIVAADAARGLASYEREIAGVRSAGSAESANEYLRGIFRSSAKISDSQAQARLRVPLAIFYAEQMRRRYDELNHALSLWVGSSGSPRGTIARLVEQDPQFVRFALDDDIQLYQWLVRDGEGDRTDLRTLVGHWRQVLALTEDVCRRVGCSSEAAVVGPVKQTGPRSLRDFVSRSDWIRFESWAANPKEERFEFNFLVGPKDSVVDQSLQLVRVVDVAVGVKRGPEIAQPNRASLVHPGVAYIPNGRGEYYKEFYPLVRKTDLAWTNDFDVDRLRLRWGRTADLSPRAFEGYGLYTVWRLSLSREDISKGADDVLINVAYQYKAPTFSSPSDNDRLSALWSENSVKVTTAGGRSANLTRGDLALLNASTGGCDRVSSLSAAIAQQVGSLGPCVTAPARSNR